MNARSLHPALEADGGVPLGVARLTDRQRLGVVLQGMAVLSHLGQCEQSLVGGWGEARVDSRGRLGGLVAGPGSGAGGPVESMRRLIEELFGVGPVVGRGSARRVVRELQERWLSDLLAVPPESLVADTLERGLFLWDAAAGPARRRLAAEIELEGQRTVWLAAPRSVRRRFLTRAGQLAPLRDLLGSDQARAIWTETPAESEDPASLLARGRWRRALRAWDESPPETDEGRRNQARAWLAVGRFERVIAALEGDDSDAAVLLVATAWSRLSSPTKARRALRQLSERPLAEDDLVTAARLASRVFANLSDPAAVASWMEKVSSAAGEPARWQAQLVMAEAAWDRGEATAMTPCLKAARPLLAEPDHAWEWYRTRALQRLATRDGEGAEADLAAALGAGRRRRTLAEAAGLWNDMAVARWQRCDLSGAERAVAHAHRLLADGDGPRAAILALRNLAELRLRRGRLHGVREILEQALVRNRIDGNERATAEDSALWVRYELVRGRPLAALRTARAALERLEEAGSDWHRAELQVLAARAAGWLEWSETSRELLDAASDALGELEPEERPAVWAHAGDRERALSAADDGPWGRLWRQALTGAPAPPEAWEAIDELEPYRAARLVWDLELAAPGTVGPEHVRRAAGALRRLDAHLLAERLEKILGGPWESVARYVADPEAEGALIRLFVATGSGEARLVHRRGGGERVLFAGPGGEAELVAPCGDGYLVLAAPQVDAVTRCVFEVVRANVRLGAAAADPGRPPVVPGLIGESEVLRGALETLPRLAAGAMPVLVLGESGTGKELVAKQVHQLSSRSAGPFVAINCAAVSESLILSDLFGHVRGAFTGAERDRMGVFETARSGTVFLDEVGDLPAAAQGMLLRVLQEGEIRRVGETLPRRVDVRIVAATHRDLQEMVERGDFRQDLYYRLRVAQIALPPLRERGSDVRQLARHFLRRSGVELSPEAVSSLLAHDWPGNVRELQNVLEVAAVLSASGIVEPEHLQIPTPEAAPVGDYQRQVEAYRRRLLVDALDTTDWNQAAAARRLGLTRQALSYLVKSLGLTRSRRP